MNHLFPLELQIEEDAMEDKIQVQAYRAEKHKAELAELRTRLKRNAETDKNLSQDELSQIISKLDQDAETVKESMHHRPRRQAALRFLERNRQMAEDNAI